MRKNLQLKKSRIIAIILENNDKNQTKGGFCVIYTLEFYYSFYSGTV